MRFSIGQIADHIASRQLTEMIRYQAEIIAPQPLPAHESNHRNLLVTFAIVVELSQHATIPAFFMDHKIRMKESNHIGLALPPAAFALRKKTSLFTFDMVVNHKRPWLRHRLLP